jgi:hypothetical protein
MLCDMGNTLTSIPGIGTIMAGKIIAYTGGIERFDNVNGFCAMQVLRQLREAQAR